MCLHRSGEIFSQELHTFSEWQKIFSDGVFISITFDPTEWKELESTLTREGKKWLLEVRKAVVDAVKEPLFQVARSWHQ